MIITRKNLIGLSIVLIWIVICVWMTISNRKKRQEEQNGWSDEKWNEYYEANENRSFRGE